VKDGERIVAAMTTTAPPVMASEAAKSRELQVNKRRATGLLVVMLVVFVILVAIGEDQGLWGYARAGAEASLVGGLADWFAVTAVFRYPLGVPIPHTAVIPARKNQFGQTLGGFVQEHLFTPEVIVERVRSSGVVPRLIDWLAEPAHAEMVAGHIADVALGVADTMNDDDVHRAIEELVTTRLDTLDLAPLAGRALAELVAQDGHDELLGNLVQGIDRFLQDNRDQLRERFVEEAPWWLPEALDRRIFDNLFDGVRKVLGEIASDPDHELRQQFERRIRKFVDDLQSSPRLRERGEQLKRDLLAQAQLRNWSAALWRDLKSTLRRQAEDPDSELRARLADAVAGAARRLQEDPALQAKAEELVESGARYVAEHFHDQISELVAATIQRWDAEETSRRLELLLGPDLQFIRINGTVVGGLAGLGIHALGDLLG
jgi:uncharacterized membrane-anchored protein YjiN (DUF445 family)